LGNPVRFILTPGQEADINQGAALIEGLDAEAVLGDKGYDSDAFVSRIQSGGAEAVIPPRANRKEPREYDENVYKERNKVERFINLIKQYRRVATRYEKTARNFLAFIQVASIMVLLR
jgi:transposase